MNEKFTNLAHWAVNTAFMEAATLGDCYVGTEHLLLGLAQSDSPCGKLLYGVGLSPEYIRRQLLAQPRQKSQSSDSADMTPKLKKLLLKAENPQITARRAVQTCFQLYLRRSVPQSGLPMQ